MKTNTILSSLFILISTFLLFGCATTGADYEAPKVDVIGIKKGQSDSALMQFTLQLRIVNPNTTALDLKGLYYALEVEGVEVVNGTANDIEPIPAFSDRVISVSSSAGMVNSMRLASVLMNEPKESLDYRLKIKLGTTSKWMPSKTIVETGTFQL